MTWSHRLLAVDLLAQVYGSCAVVNQAASRLCDALPVPFSRTTARLPIEIRRFVGRDGTVYIDRDGVAEALKILREVAPCEVMMLAAAIDLAPFRCWCMACDRRLAGLEAWMDNKGIEDDQARLKIIFSQQRKAAVPSMMEIAAKGMRVADEEAV